MFYGVISFMASKSVRRIDSKAKVFLKEAFCILQESRGIDKLRELGSQRNFFSQLVLSFLGSSIL